MKVAKVLGLAGLPGVFGCDRVLLPPGAGNRGVLPFSTTTGGRSGGLVSVGDGVAVDLRHLVGAHFPQW